jgi:hypothetical protein
MTCSANAARTLRCCQTAMTISQRWEREKGSAVVMSESQAGVRKDSPIFQGLAFAVPWRLQNPAASNRMPDAD